MVFVTLEHRYLQNNRARIVFLGPASLNSAAMANGNWAVAPSDSERLWPMSEALLFRFSALTFNAHRIHYDQPYAAGEAGYPGLVVHGQLQAMLLAETLRAASPERRLRRATFRARAPLFSNGAGVCVRTAPPIVTGDTCEQTMWTRACDGGVATEATFEF